MATLNGLERFQTHFAGYSDSYALIGGIACALWFETGGLEFRATKDFDVVLLAENVTLEFAREIWAFVDAAGYRTKERSDPQHQYYRFTHPEDERYPTLLELFARKPQGLEIPSEQTIAPISVDETVSSLSAILLDDDYYELIRQHKQIEDGLPLATPPILIVLKAKAWLDLTARRENGESVKGNDINKHRSDVFRLTALLDEETTIALPESVRTELQQFLDRFPPDSPEWPAIQSSLESTGIRRITAATLRQNIAQTFDLKQR